jgi:hypothetical protein
MGAFRRSFSNLSFPRNTLKAAGQCEQISGTRAEKSAATASIAGGPVAFDRQKQRILLGFLRWHGVCCL